MNTRYGNAQNSGNNSATLTGESEQINNDQSQYQDSSQADSQQLEAQAQPATSQALQHQLDSTQRGLRQSIAFKQ